MKYEKILFIIQSYNYIYRQLIDIDRAFDILDNVEPPHTSGFRVKTNFVIIGWQEFTE